MVSRTVNLVAGEWTELTTADVDSIRLQVQGGYHAALKATNGPEPTDFQGAIQWMPNAILPASVPLEDLFPDVTPPMRLWAYGLGSVSVSHG